MIGFLFYMKRMREGYSPERAKRRKGIRRLISFVLIVGCILSTLALRAAKADVAKGSMIVAQQLAPLAPLRANSGENPNANVDATEIRLNGESMFISRSIVNEASSTSSLTETLDRFEAECSRNNPGSGVTGLLQALGAAAGATTTIRTEERTGGSAMVLCFAKGSETPSSLSAATDQFAETGDLGALGKLRYAVAKRTKSGRIELFTATTQDSFNIKKIAPTDGSEPSGGTDSAVVSRPPIARRVLSAEVVGTPFGIRVYESASSIASLHAKYIDEMTAKGFVRIESVHETSHGELHGFFKEGLQIFVAIYPDARAGMTIVSIAETSSAASENPSLQKKDDDTTEELGGRSL